MKVIVVILLLASNGWAQAPDYNSRSVMGSVGGGVGSYNTYSPGGDIRLNNGGLVNIEMERGVGLAPFYIYGAAQFLFTSGQLNYNYTSYVANYVQSNVNVNWQEYQLALGLRYKLFETTAIQPFVGLGGSLGMASLYYDNSLKTTAILAAGSDYKMQDSNVDFGLYGEIGLLLHFNNSTGLKANYVYMSGNTLPFDTLKKQVVRWSSGFANLALFTHF